MRGMDLKHVEAAVEGRLCLPEVYRKGSLELEAEAVVIDSRKIVPGAIFVATKGERVDGHDFINQVFENDALGVICEKLPEEVKGPCILVEDSFAALRKLAKYYRSVMSEVKVVGIVGSVGKTSTKELVASVLEQKYKTLKTEGNYNNEIGVPLTIFRLRDEHEAAVVEMGINKFGEMDRLGDIVKPDAVVMTNIGPCHLEFLGDLDGVLKAKSEVFGHIKAGGLLVLNAEDEKLNTVREVEQVNIVRYGKGSPVEASNIEGLGLEGSRFNVAIRDLPMNCAAAGQSLGCAVTKSVAAIGGIEGEFEATVHLTGRHMVMNALAATVVGLYFGMKTDRIAAGIEAAKPVSGRSNLIKTDKYLVVDDCYNANPKADKAAIDLMKEALGRRCAILGDMFELGENADELHGEVGTYAAENGIDMLVCVGELSKNMYEAAGKAGSNCELIYYATKTELMNELNTLDFRAGDTILVKASHGMGFAEIVEALKSL